MAIRAVIHRHPHIAAMVTFVLTFVIWEWLLPLAWHQPPDWRVSVSMSVVLLLLSYFNRLRTVRVKALILGALSLGMLALYATAVGAHGVPQETTEQFYFAFVVAIPIVGIVWALRMLRRLRASA